MVSEVQTELTAAETEWIVEEIEPVVIDPEELEDGTDGAAAGTQEAEEPLEDAVPIVADDEESAGKPGVEEPLTETEQTEEISTEEQTEAQTEQTSKKKSGNRKNKKKTQKETQKETQAETPAETPDSGASTVSAVTKPETAAENVPESETQTEAKTEKAVESKTQTEAKTEKTVESETQTEAMTEEETESETQTEAMTEEETESETQTETKAKTKTEKTVESETQTEALTEEETESETQTETKAKTEKTVESETQTEAKTEEETESGTQTETKAKTKTKTKTKTGKMVENKTQTEAKTEEETESETQTETQTEEETETEAEPEAGVRIVNDMVRVREQPSTDAEQIASMSAGMQVYAMGETGEWTHILFESPEGMTEGYIKTEYLEGTDNLYSVKETINVRKEASTDSDKLGMLSAGDSVLVLETADDGWVKIKYRDETGAAAQNAYVMLEYLEKAETDDSRLVTLVENYIQSEDSDETATEEIETGETAADESGTGSAQAEERQETENDAGTDAGDETEPVTDADADETEPVTDADTDETEPVTDADADETEPVTDADADETERVTDVDADETEAGESVTLTVPGLCTVNSFHVNVRRQPSTEGEILASLSNDMMVYAADIDGEWARIFFESANGVEEGYIKTEFLNKSDAENARIAEMARERMQETDSEPDQTKEQTGSPDETENGNEAEAETEAEAEPGAEGQTEAEAEPGADDQAEAETETEADDETEAMTETEAGPLDLSEGAQSQFELMKALLSDAQDVGIIYSSENKNAQAQVEEYESLAESYGVELTFKEIESDLDIDLAASELVDSADCIFCLDDPLVDGLLQTVCAYANEMEIPVIGLKQSQLDSGCIAAYESGELHWNEEAAKELGLSGQAPEVESKE